ncbi:modification methylase [Campylobacter jejuni subsp. doylei]|uniref:DNA (cytosine-5-)-methyltransferase n=1 Tax=Campylobacter jejuni subsp. doylei TaxID=32021 RepID=A0A448JBF1_CAMJU|nr:DNA (cytosine-5-)-methyltransferase [Campylobacter jejuni]VEG61988.1 modification methylase [Campylobacter jejuni subsp. doylei]
MLKNGVLTYVSLFSSAGVGCYGFKELGYECIATNEIIERRLNIQKINNKCKYENAYISGDIKEERIKNKILEQVHFYKKLGNDMVDVVIATPPCQGMSVANHKKKHNEINRNSLVVESIELIHRINPRFFILENVASFYKTGCINENDEIISIGEMIENKLSNNYIIYNDVINFKNYGANSSRTRALVIGVHNSLNDFITPLEIFPDFEREKTLKEILGRLKSLKWGEYDKNDFYHSFRVYPEYMRNWIKDLKEGQSAFENKEDFKKPHKIENGILVVNVAKNGDKYRRQKWDSVCPCIHTRNDQLASQNTIHPKDDRVFSIRELMLVMNIPASFKWIELDINKINTLSDVEKVNLSKKVEMNIRQSIGEAVPTIIFRKIAEKIKKNMQLKNYKDKEIFQLIKNNDLYNFNKLKNFIKQNQNLISLSSLLRISELSNIQRLKDSAYFTNKFITNEIAKTLPNFDKKTITIIEPSVGCGNFLPIIFKKYSHIESVKLKLIDINEKNLEILKIIYKDLVPNNFNLEFICDDFLQLRNEKADLIIGNPPFSKIKSKNLSELFLEKAIQEADFVSMIMPKNLLNTREYADIRIKLYQRGVSHILDFGEKGFSGVLIETINIAIGRSKEVFIKSFPLNIKLIQKSSYIFDNNLPYWVIFRNDFFDCVFKSLEFGVFEVFRDRQLTKSNTSLLKNDIRVIKSRNISNNGKIINIEGYDSYISKDNLKKFKIYNYLNKNDVYLTPNMTYNPRLIKKEKGYVVNGSVAILIPKKYVNLTRKQREYFSSEEFREFYKIARNYQTRTLNIDSVSCFWFGIKKELG